MPVAGKTIAIAIADTENHVLARQALAHSCQLFPPDQVIVFSDQPDRWPGFPVQVVPPMRSMADYNRLITRDLAAVLTCDFVLVIQYDGFVLHAQEFAPLFLHYDYLGAPWSHFQEFNVGNGGFSLRSRRLVEAVAKLPYPDPEFPEDVYICRLLRAQLELQGLRFAPADVARHFSVEYPAAPWNTFGFHGVFHLPKVYREGMGFLMDHLSPRTLAQKNPLLMAAVRDVDPAYLLYFGG